MLHGLYDYYYNPALAAISLSLTHSSLSLSHTLSLLRSRTKCRCTHALKLRAEDVWSDTYVCISSGPPTAHRPIRSPVIRIRIPATTGEILIHFNLSRYVTKRCRTHEPRSVRGRIKSMVNSVYVLYGDEISYLYYYYY